MFCIFRNKTLFTLNNSEDFFHKNCFELQVFFHYAWGKAIFLMIYKKNCLD